MNKKMIPAVLLCAALLSGCGSTSAAGDAQTAETAQETEVIPDITEAEETVPVLTEETESPETAPAETVTVETAAAETAAAETAAPEAATWEGKRAIMFGDSITWYDGHNALTGSHELEVGYESYLKNLGFAEVANKGENGACIALQGGATYIDILTTVQNTDVSGYDLITVAGGINDYAYFDSPMGELSSGGYDTSTFYGGYQTIIETLQAANPSAVIVLFTPLQSENCSVPNDYGLILSDYADAVQEIGAYYGLPVLDLYNDSGLNQENLSSLTLDGVHPNNDGFRVISEGALLPFIEALA